MKSIKIISGLLIVSISMISCGLNENKEVKTNPQKETVTAPSENGISIEEIDHKRAEIESLEITPIEVSTLDLRKKIQQKWSKIHFYVQNDIVVKVKTYPYSEISKRTEEFYADKDGLLLVVIEDNGEGPKGKQKNEFDKMYYFNNGKLIKEMNKEKASEYTIKESDAEELSSEYIEYLDLYKKNKK